MIKFMQIMVVSAVFGLFVAPTLTLAADTSCKIAPSIQKCGGINMSDAGCSVACAESGGWEALCDSSVCHSLSPDHVNDVCNSSGTVCVTGTDGLKYVFSPSSCFCD